MKAYAYDQDGYLVASFQAQVDPLETKAQGKKVYLIPPGATLIAPTVTLGPGEVAKWTGRDWVGVVPPKPFELEPEEPETPELTQEEIDRQEAQRARAELIKVATDSLIAKRKNGIKPADVPLMIDDILVLIFGE